MHKPAVTSNLIVKVSGDTRQEDTDLLAVEEPLEIRIGYGKAGEREQKNVAITMRTPGHDFELATGFLFTEGIISNKEDIVLIKYCTEAATKENNQNVIRVELKDGLIFNADVLQRNFYTTSSCGVCGKASIDAVKKTCKLSPQQNNLTLSPAFLLTLPDKVRQHQSVFEYTGGLHASAYFDLSGKLLLLREDVGRHNALDKLIGAALATGMLNLENRMCNGILLLSGRASFELLQKAAMAGINVVCAIGAPSSLAVETAKDVDITLIGFLRDNRFNIYSGAQRITKT